ncbi:MAG: surface lipoprotein assembly modifier [Parasphingorhabdus sp.]
MELATLPAKVGLISGICMAALLAVPAKAETSDEADAVTMVRLVQPDCDESGRCEVRVTPKQMLAKAEQLIRQKQYQTALPLVEALRQVPDLKMQQQFLAGFIAVETGDLKGAISNFRGILEENPGQTRVRLELARAYLMSGKESAADYHFRLAQNDDNLPDEIARTIRNTRSILRDQRVWRFSFDFGFAPDTNINGATNAETIDFNFGPIKQRLTLSDEARETSGIGQTAGFSGGVRLKANEKLAFLFDADSRMINYKGTASDDIVSQLAFGPEFKLGSYTSVSVQAVGQQRWFGGSLATREYGGRLGLQKVLSQGQRMGMELDARKIDSKLSDSYSGWRLGANATYEHLIGKSLIASASVFARRDLLESKSFSSLNYGLNLGIGGELPLGFNAGVSGSISRSVFDEAIIFYSAEKRSDWRSYARAYVGNRKVRFLGFSPSIDYNYSRVDSNYDLYQMNRHRVNFKLAKFF